MVFWQSKRASHPLHPACPVPAQVRPRFTQLARKRYQALYTITIRNSGPDPMVQATQLISSLAEDAWS